jgi:predicted transcriptional regulator
MEYGSRESRVTGSWASPPPPSPSAGEAAASGERPRSALKIRLDILEGVRDNGPSRSSRILSGRAYPEYLRELVSLGLLSEERDGDANSYTLTAKGLDFVNRVKEAQAFAAALGLTM